MRVVKKLKTLRDNRVEGSGGCMESDQSRLDRSMLNHLYTVVACILMMVSDPPTQSLLPSMSVDAPWYSERAVSQVRDDSPRFL